MSEQNNIGNNKRIAKNTLLLYFRMLLIMGVMLFMSRVVLDVLGVIDYGIYNVTGGIVAMFSFINTAMASATQRYITYSLGKGNFDNLSKVFSTSIQIHAIISLFIILLGETFGLWFLYNKLVIPPDRMHAAFWVFQCSIVTSVISIMSVPYNAAIIAHEKMSAFAYISIIDVTLKLLVVYILYTIRFDKLIVYAVLIMAVQAFIRYIYIKYCDRCFIETKYKHCIDKPLLKEMSGFAGWSFFGNFAYVLYTQGQNILLNVFFGPVVNAARAVAVQVQTAIQQFAGNFQMALNPQITKNYAIGNLPQMHSLMFRSARFSFFLLYMFILPVILETQYLLELWLKKVPDNTVIFTQLILTISLLTPFSSPCSIANQATGKVKKFQMIVGCLLMMILPISYIVLKMGAPSYSVFIVHFCVEAVAVFARMYMLRNLIELPLIEYIKHVFTNVLIVLIVSAPIPYLIHNSMNYSFIRLITVCITCFTTTGISIYIFGLTSVEKDFLLEKVKLKIQKFH